MRVGGGKERKGERGEKEEWKDSVREGGIKGEGLFDVERKDGVYSNSPIL